MKVVFLEEEVECLLKVGGVVGRNVEVGRRGVVEKSLDVGFKLLAVVAGLTGLVVAWASGRPGVLHDADSALCSRCSRKYKKTEGREVYKEVEGGTMWVWGERN